jgi:hypothetical protein
VQIGGKKMPVTALKIASEDYHSPESNLKYLSNSQYKDFMTCEAMAVAKMVGEWNPEPSIEMLVGSYVHAWNEGEEAFKSFKASTPDMFNKNGSMKAQFLFADQMIGTLQDDPMCMEMLAGQKEVILTAEMFGVPWKIKMDSYRPGEAIIDLKTTRSIYELVWSPYFNAKVSFIEAFDYVTQFAIYLEIERIATGSKKWLQPLIVAVSKEAPPDKAVIDMTDTDRYKAILFNIRENIPRIMAIKAGEISPVRCERCNYCRATKKLKEIFSYHQLERSE